MTHPVIDFLKPTDPGDPLSLRGHAIRTVLTSAIVIGLSTFNLYHVSKQIAPGQQQYSSYSERVSRDHQGNLIRDVIAVNTVVFLTTGTSYSRPLDWNPGSNSIECIGGGGSGGNPGICGCFTVGGPGNAGGSYSKSVNLAIGATATYAIGAGASVAGSAGGDSYFNATSAANAATLGNTVACAAKGSSNSTALNTGTVTFGGGNGGGVGVGAAGGGGGGGAGGPNATGIVGTAGAGTGGPGGRGDGTFGGTGGAANTGGNPGAEFTSNPGGTTAGSGGGGGGGTGAGNGGLGGLYGGGGAGAGVSGVFGSGRQGIIIVSYAPFVPIAGQNWVMPIFTKEVMGYQNG